MEKGQIQENFPFQLILKLALGHLAGKWTNPHVLNLSSISLATFPVSSSLVHLEVAGSGLRGLEEDLEDLEEDQQIRSYLDAFCLWQRKRRMVIASKYS